MPGTVDQNIGGIFRQKGLSSEILRGQRTALDTRLRGDPQYMDDIQAIDERVATIRGFDLRIKELLAMDGNQELMDLGTQGGK